MKLVKYKLTDISSPRQWKSLSMSEMTDIGYPVYSANGLIGKYKEFNHKNPTITIGCRGTCGTIHITEPNSYITSNAMALDDLDKEKIDIRYLYYTLKNYDFKKIITGTSQPQITREGLQKVVLIIPQSKQDQLHIANLLSKAETLISQRKESILLLDQYLKSTFLEMFGSNFYTEKRWKLEPFGNFILTLTDYHANGSYESLRDIVTLKKEPDFALMVRTTDLENNNFTNNCNYIDERAYNFLEKSKVFGGEIIINKIGSAGKVYLMPFLKKPVSLGMNAFLLRFDNRLNNIFTFFLLSSSFGENEIQKNVKGAVTKTITKDAIRGIRIPIPPISLQTQFAQIVEKTEVLKAQYQQCLQELENLYGSLSQKAFKGELTIKEEYISQAAEPSMEYKKSEKF